MKDDSSWIDKDLPWDGFWSYVLDDADTPSDDEDVVSKKIIKKKKKKELIVSRVPEDEGTWCTGDSGTQRSRLGKILKPTDDGSSFFDQIDKSTQAEETVTVEETLVTDGSPKVTVVNKVYEPMDGSIVSNPEGRHIIFFENEELTKKEERPADTEPMSVSCMGGSCLDNDESSTGMVLSEEGYFYPVNSEVDFTKTCSYSNAHDPLGLPALFGGSVFDDDDDSFVEIREWSIKKRQQMAPKKWERNIQIQDRKHFYIKTKPSLHLATSKLNCHKKTQKGGREESKNVSPDLAKGGNKVSQDLAKFSPRLTKGDRKRSFFRCRVQKV